LLFKSGKDGFEAKDVVKSKQVFVIPHGRKEAQHATKQPKFKTDLLRVRE
jgi:hypothetical protein